MSNTNTLTPAAAPILSQQATTASYPPTNHRGSTNCNQLPDFPQQWKLPSSLYARLHAIIFCPVCTGQPDLEGFWQQLVKDGGWERYLTASCDAVTQITTAQGLVLAVDAAFMTTIPPLPSVDYASHGCYRALSVSFLFCIIGLVFQVMFFGINRTLSQQITLRNPMSRNALLCYFAISLFPLYAFVISLYALAFAFLSALVKLGYVLSMTIVLVYALFPKFGHPNTSVILTCIFASVLFDIGILICILILTS
ncbi:hypothetical protein M405DRAFT_808885 [Rhizopogon salebrosus TDB-379]|nr:hypothetical protein M405DRAFT_808885 [Rhizopogon salebrosus TDB-379]